MSGDASVLLDIDGATATLTLNRPARLNALDHHMAGDLLNGIHQVAARPGLRVLLVRGRGTAFCAGGDIAAMKASQDDLPGFIRRTITPFHAAMLALRRLPMPVIACVQGAAAGGGFSLAQACDLVLATKSARFVVAYAQLGAPADGGLSFYLTQRLGALRALEVLTIHGQLGAERALSLGLVNCVVEDVALDETAAKWTARLLALAPQSLREIKHLVAAQSTETLAAHLDREQDAFLRCAATPEFAARVSAFSNKPLPA